MPEPKRQTAAGAVTPPKPTTPPPRAPGSFSPTRNAGSTGRVLSADEVELLRVHRRMLQDITIANSEWITAVCAALDMSVEAEPDAVVAVVARLRAVEQRAREALADRPAAASVDPPWESVHQAARYTLTGETR